jgi:hypothetical protein
MSSRGAPVSQILLGFPSQFPTLLAGKLVELVLLKLMMIFKNIRKNERKILSARIGSSDIRGKLMAHFRLTFACFSITSFLPFLSFLFFYSQKIYEESKTTGRYPTLSGSTLHSFKPYEYHKSARQGNPRRCIQNCTSLV